MALTDREDAHRETQDAWETNAAYWDERMGEGGNDFVNVLQWPAIERLLDVQPGERMLDVACGNGLMSRRLGRLGAAVVGFDFAPAMVAHARQRTRLEDGDIEYRVIDATDESALLSLGEGQFDAALSNMALFDMAEVDPLFRALMRLLKPGGRFVFTLMHPCFNNPHTVQMAELEDRDGTLVTTYSIKVCGYMTSCMRRGLAIRGQPKPQVYFHRPLQEILGCGLAAGFVIDGLEERAFPPEHPQGNSPLTWGSNFSEIPPVLVVRMRLPRR